MIFWNKEVLVTGGSSGIGLATATEFARRGARVWLLARNEAQLESAQSLVVAACGRRDACRTLRADVRDPEQIANAIAQMEAGGVALDIAVNSAGISRPGYFEVLKLSVFRDAIDTNYYGTLHVCRAVAPGMMARRSGHIVNICTAGAILPAFGYSAYSASKHAVRGLTEVLRLELKRYGVGVSIVYPADTDTPQLADEDPYKPPETRALNGGVVLRPETVGRAIVDGVARNRFIIVPGLAPRVLLRLAELLGGLQYPILDFIVGRAQHKSA